MMNYFHIFPIINMIHNEKCQLLNCQSFLFFFLVEEKWVIRDTKVDKYLNKIPKCVYIQITGSSDIGFDMR